MKFLDEHLHKTFQQLKVLKFMMYDPKLPESLYLPHENLEELVIHRQYYGKNYIEEEILSKIVRDKK